VPQALGCKHSVAIRPSPPYLPLMNFRAYSIHPELSDFIAFEAGRAKILVRRGYQESADRLIGDGDFSGETVSGGRAAHPLVELPGGERAVVREYQRGGAMRHINRARYFAGHRAFAELHATERARCGGVRVPLVLAAVERRERFGYTAALSTLWIPDAASLVSHLIAADAIARAAVMEDAGREIARMHAAGVAHPDLNLNNILVATAVHLLDFDSARLYEGAVPAARRARDLERLARSARKLKAPIGPREWDALREGYGDDWPL